MSLENVSLAEDFLIQNSFQHYCAESDEQCVRYWENYIKSNPDQLENILEAKRLYFILNGSKKSLGHSVQNIEDRISNRRIFSFHKSTLLSVAAILIAIISISSIVYLMSSNDKVPKELNLSTVENTQMEFKALHGERKKLKLPDGTTVLLNAGSTLTIDENFKKGKRNVFLNGEGYFDVTHNNTAFIVHTKDFNVKVLGTKFNVKAYDEDLFSETVLIQGAVQLELINRKNELLALKPGEKLTIRNKEEIASKDQINSVSNQSLEEIKLSQNTLSEDNVIVETAWTDNRIEIHNESFKDIKSTLERWYDVDIDIRDKGLEQYVFTAIFTTETIQEALEALQKAKSFNYQIKGNKIMITK